MGRFEVTYKDGMVSSIDISGNSPYLPPVVDDKGNRSFPLIYDSMLNFVTKEQVASARLFLDCGHCRNSFEVLAPYRSAKKCETCKKQKYVCQDCFESQDAFHADGEGEPKREKEEIEVEA